MKKLLVRIGSLTIIAMVDEEVQAVRQVSRLPCQLSKIGIAHIDAADEVLSKLKDGLLLASQLLSFPRGSGEP